MAEPAYHEGRRAEAPEGQVKRKCPWYSTLWRWGFMKFGLIDWNPSVRGVLQGLHAFMDNDSGKAWPSQRTLSAFTGYSKSRISIAVNRAEEDGFLRITRPPGRPCEYQAVIPVEVKIRLKAEGYDLTAIPKPGGDEVTTSPDLVTADLALPSHHTNSLENSFPTRTVAGTDQEGTHTAPRDTDGSVGPTFLDALFRVMSQEDWLFLAVETRRSPADLQALGL